MRKSLALLALLATFSSAESIVYENAEDGSIAKWVVEDGTPAGATIRVVYDDELKSNVIELKGTGEENSFRLRKSNGEPWHDTSHFIIKWKQKSDSPFVVYVMVKTTKGDKYITFCNCPKDRVLMRGSMELSFGLGRDADDGTWHQFEENLEERLHQLMPDAKLLSVEGLIVRGSGRFDDIILTDGKDDTTTPPAPATASASEISGHSVTLQWDDVEGEKGYKIYKNGEEIAVTDENVTTYTDNNVSEETTYTYVIKAFNDAGESEGVEVEVTTPKDVTPPSPVGGLEAAEVTPTSVTLKWEDTSDNESGFEIYRNDLLIFTTKPNVTTYTDENLTAGETYLYIIKAVNEAGKSEGVELEVTTPEDNTTVIPSAPGDLNATEITSNSVTLNWSDNSDNETGFQIIRNGELIFLTAPNVTSYTDENLTAGETYTYEVRAVNEAGVSEPSNPIEVKTKEAIITLSAPANIAFLDITPTSVTITWEDTSDNETGFKIIRDGELITVTEANATSYTDENLSAGKEYTYEIIATDGTHDSTPLIGKVSTDSGIPADVSDLKAEVNGTTVTLKWKDNSDNETGFKILRDGEEIAVTEANVTSYTDENLSSDTEYEYTVKAVNEYGESEGVSVKVKTAMDPVETYVMYLYHTVLDREPEKEGFEYWTQKLKEGYSAASVAKGFFVITNELQSKNLSNEEYVRKLFVTLYQREPLPGELAYWTKLLDENALNRNLVFDKLVYTNEFIRLAKSYNLKPFDEDEMLYSRIESLYYLILGRKASYGEVEYWVSLLKDGKISYEQIVRNFFNSKEFQNKKVSDEEFIRAAYRAILNREPDYAGFKYWEHRLQTDLTRDQLLDYIFSSPEYQFLSNLEGYKKP